MPEISGGTEILITVPTHPLYEYLLDLTRHPEWSSNLSQVTQLTPGAITVGTRFKTSEGPPPVSPWMKLNMMRGFVRGVLAGAKPYSVAEITSLEPDRRIAWEAGIPYGEGYFSRAEWEFLFETRGAGTLLRQRFRYLPQMAAAEQMVNAAGVQGITSACAVNLKRLKRVAEEKLALAPKQEKTLQGLDP